MRKPSRGLIDLVCYHKRKRGSGPEVNKRGPAKMDTNSREGLFATGDEAILVLNLEKKFMWRALSTPSSSQDPIRRLVFRRHLEEILERWPWRG
ncbi:hypothetical protein NPIL_60241 [Nephila pilipes]|uniref:Uncharacterized protein n=1 Tax=Nephila pilipes TaxID=299642 RepID=A0A8X6TS48_NEPPI|nr:hypothetical protein NPIL_60241 [Nephila pilipes]